MALNLHKSNKQIGDNALSGLGTMMIQSAIDNRETSLDLSSSYYSVEFALAAPYPVYQFKLRHSDSNSHFFLVKENASVLSELKVGHIWPMKYYSDETLYETRVHNTQILKMINETKGRFRGHCRIQLEIVQDTQPCLLH